MPVGSEDVGSGLDTGAAAALLSRGTTVPLSPVKKMFPRRRRTHTAHNLLQNKSTHPQVPTGAFTQL